MTILDQILERKKEEVKTLKQLDLNDQITTDKPVHSLYDSFIKSRQLSVIAEIKRASPSKGDINVGMEPTDQAKLYQTGGASGVSVLTDTPFFKGSMEDLTNVRAVTDIPILCKDFIIDEVQIDYAYQAGANVILLITAALQASRLKELYQYATNLGLEVLLEVHDETELEAANDVNPNIIGINNRDLKTFNVDLGVTERLADKITDPNIVIISESGIKTKADAERVASAGAHAILVGESLMMSDSVVNSLKSLQVDKELL
ncbi:indole-3-glycerol phosphate synthase TrpC [Tenuibacillus multivorans]|uniref:Indole-3-glycerol phosphate synthase n=1 Tax=Tenuibacillus multivorans TaxID=237069 RepID=A0A1H0AZ86_9BACI|nr:indole-3-glycerol phosphate synthase TrpC [Tenuibacillus multivorans]GEL77600.1 indole-3-glycerol phosphate synthase [Tenuibacillus multivorans]SDN38767.1 indole-3-glycerol phosphate synthase [Tenuibacillus multivorans]